MDQHIDNKTKKRLVKDIRDLYKSPLTDQGIYYNHDMDDILKGYAMIIGPEGSVYENGYYFFTFNFPTDYPFSPPKLHFSINSGKTRYHPNLYRTGKVCLSIVNTWRGEGWTSCQSIRSILITLVSILDDKPLLHEPGIKETHSDFNTYNHIIRYKNIKCNIINNLKDDTNYPIQFSIFKPFMKQQFIKNYDNITKRIKKYNNEGNNKKLKLSTVIYRTIAFIDYKLLENELVSLYEKLK